MSITGNAFRKIRRMGRPLQMVRFPAPDNADEGFRVHPTRRLEHRLAERREAADAWIDANPNARVQRLLVRTTIIRRLQEKIDREIHTVVAMRSPAARRQRPQLRLVK